MNKEEFIKELKKLNIELNNDTLAKLDEYYNILNEENKKYNLTRIITKEEVYLKHFYDSLTITKIINIKDQRLNGWISHQRQRYVGRKNPLTNEQIKNRRICQNKQRKI